LSEKPQTFASSPCFETTSNDIHVRCILTVTLDLPSKFHTPSYNGSVIATKQKTNYTLHSRHVVV